MHELMAPVEIEFRDGVRAVAPHVAQMIAASDIDPVRYTFEEALGLSQDSILKTRLNGAQQNLIQRHFRDY
jgi:hypothetical protein